MSQHFLVSAASRTLKVKDIYAMGEAKAYEKFCELRWASTEGEPVCPDCGSLEHYKITTRRRFKCVDCKHQYSVTSGTIFSSRKMSFTDLLVGMCLFANAVKGVSALQFARDMGCNAKTGFVMLHKIREAVASETQDTTLAGEIEIDGAFFGGHVRPANLKENRIDRRLGENKSGKRRVVIALRQRAGRTLPFVSTSEAHGVLIAARVVDKDSIARLLPTKPRIGTRSMRNTRRRGSIIRRHTASTASTPIRLKAISPGFAAWCGANIITCLRVIFISMQMKPPGKKITAASTTARSHIARSAWRWRIHAAGISPATGTAEATT